MNEREIGVNQFLARNPNPLSKSLNNNLNLVLHVFWCVLVMATTFVIPYKEIEMSNIYFIPPAPPPSDLDDNSSWDNYPIDIFVNAHLEQQNRIIFIPMTPI